MVRKDLINFLFFSTFPAVDLLIYFNYLLKKCYDMYESMDIQNFLLKKLKSRKNNRIAVNLENIDRFNVNFKKLRNLKEQQISVGDFVNKINKYKKIIDIVKINIIDLNTKRKNNKTFRKSLLTITNMEY